MYLLPCHSDASLLCASPTIELLSKLVVPRISLRWKYVGLQLGVSSDCLNEIEREQIKVDHSCHAMFEQWLQCSPGTGSKQRLWDSVLSAVEIGHSTEAEMKIREELAEVTAWPDYQPANPDDKVKECMQTRVRLKRSCFTPPSMTTSDFGSDVHVPMLYYTCSWTL